MLKKIRNREGFSQRQLAARSGVSFRCIQQLEEPGHNWRVDSLRRVAKGLALSPGGLDQLVDRFLSIVPGSAEDASIRIQQDGFDSWKIHLFNFVDRFRKDQDASLIEHAPIQELDPKLQALMASSMEMLCHEIRVERPPWGRGVPALDHPWFVAGIENLKAAALVESPSFYRARNIFVLGNFLDRV